MTGGRRASALGAAATVERAARRPGARTGSVRRLAKIAAAVGLAACAPRQAVVESDPSGGVESRRQLEAAARNDLDRLRRLEEDHHGEAGRYTYEMAALGFEASGGVRISVLAATTDGFSAVAQAGSVECGLYVGSAEPPRSYTTTAAVVACR